MNKPMQNPIIEHTPVMKIFDAIALTICFAFNALVLDANWLSILIAVGGSLSGAMMLAYFRRDTTLWELVLKVGSSSIGGLVLGTVIQEYLHVSPPAYQLGLFFFSSLLALVVLGALLSLADNNITAILKNIVQKLAGIQLETKEIKQEVKTSKKKIEKLEHDQEER